MKGRSRNSKASARVSIGMQKGTSFVGGTLLSHGLAHQTLQPRPRFACSLIGTETNLFDPWSHGDHLLSGDASYRLYYGTESRGVDSCWDN